MYCDRCGVYLDEGLNFCNACGADLTGQVQPGEIHGGSTVKTLDANARRHKGWLPILVCVGVALVVMVSAGVVVAKQGLIDTSALPWVGSTHDEHFHAIDGSSLVSDASEDAVDKSSRKETVVMGKESIDSSEGAKDSKEESTPADKTKGSETEGAKQEKLDKPKESEKNGGGKQQGSTPAEPSGA